MVTYIYFVKCPDCEDEYFDFFDEAKEFALGCLSKKPIITQTEVCRNDFGECTDHSDLGTIWSWEDECRDAEGDCTEAESAKSIFTKDDLKRMADGSDPEFDSIDNSVDFEVEEPVTSEISAIDDVPDNFRKPIPEGMTIEELVEEMEENEDEVECTWCEDLFDKSECRYEVNLGWLCDRCQSAIMSRGESLTFREGNYWDFLDEDAAEPEAVHDLGNEYDGGYPEDNTDVLMENFPYFRYAQEDIKQTLIRRVLEDPTVRRFITPDGVIRAMAQHARPNGGPGQVTFGYVIDFDVVGDQIIVVLDRGNGVIHREELEDFMRGQFFGRRLYRQCAAGILLRRLLDVARELNRELNPGIAVRRNDAVANAVAVMNDATLEELRTHIKDIVFRIPYDGYVEQDIADIDPEADENRKLAKQAVKKLKDLNASFFALDFADEVNVETRYVPSSEKASFIIHDWGNEAIIKFDCPISQLSDDAKQLIRETRYSNAELKETSKQVNNYRLAKELCLRYGAGFYLNNNQLHEASLSDIAAAANSEYGTGYSERDLLNDAGVEDMDFFDDLETPAQVYAQSYRNKRRRQAYAINKAKAAKTDSMLEELEDADSYKSHLVMCPECGFETLDVETGICINCGFNSLLTESIAEDIDFDNIPIVDAE